MKKKISKIKLNRVLAEMSQEELASRLGTYQVRVHRLETGKAKPTREEIKKIKAVFDE